MFCEPLVAQILSVHGLTLTAMAHELEQLTDVCHVATPSFSTALGIPSTKPHLQLTIGEGELR